ncbi:hypothetical protein KKA17_07610 [bacterium]|nr:hypothetical protein [bacterium]MBU1883256.1 hypothetical protein [bacterium]
MKKIILLYLTLVSLAFGYSYDDVLLKAQASIFPKIILLDKKIENKLVEGKIVYTIVYDKNDYYTALDISKYIEEKYHGHLGQYEYTVNLVEFSKLSDATEASAFYVLNLDKYTDKIAEMAKERGVISFSYDINNLNQGIMFSLVIEKSTVIYLEKETLFTQKIDFVDALLQIVKFTDKNTALNKIKNDSRLERDQWYAKIIAYKNHNKS